MPAWIAGIHQVRKDASGSIHVSLDSSTPCWNDTIEGSTFKHSSIKKPPRAAHASRPHRVSTSGFTGDRGGSPLRARATSSAALV